MKLRKTLIALSLVAVFTSIFFACSKNENSAGNGKARLQVFLIDAPASYDAVHIDVQDIRINYSTDTSGGWQNLANVNTGVYDLLELTNGNEAMLADAEINTGRIQQIRLVLGPNNFVTVNGVDYPLETPSAQQSGLKLNIHQDVSEGLLYKLTLDFDASKSIVKTGNGKYILKPTIRTVLESVGGSIKGFVLPNTFNTAVYAIQGPDTIAGTTTLSGAYLIKGLSAGSYDVAFAPGDTTYQSQTIPGVNVTANMVTIVDTVTLVQ